MITKKAEALTLYDSKSNDNAITIANGNTANVTIQGRTLYKDGDWNSLCFPFALSAEQIASSPLAGAVIKQLSSATLSEDNTVLTLNFSDATMLEAGVPYFVKWETAGADITNPVFSNVIVADGKVRFLGSHSPVYCGANNKNLLFLGVNSQFYYPSVSGLLNSFRGYFLIDDEMSNSVKQVKMGLEDATSVRDIEAVGNNGSWFTIGGVKLENAPLHPGVYITNGKKIVIR